MVGRQILRDFSLKIVYSVGTIIIFMWRWCNLSNYYYTYLIGQNKITKIIKGEFMCKPIEKLRGKSAEHILKTYGNIYKYPVDIEEIIRNIGNIEIGSMDFSELEKVEMPPEGAHIIGALRVFDNNVQIIYSDRFPSDNSLEYSNMSDEEIKNKLRKRQRFTLAHELAHCSLHIDPKTRGYYVELHSDNDKLVEDNREFVANAFAGELLMPSNIIHEFISNPDYYDIKGNDGKISISKMADAFDVNNSVMCERIRNIRISEGLYKNISFDVEGIRNAGDLQ